MSDSINNKNTKQLKDINNKYDLSLHSPAQLRWHLVVLAAILAGLASVYPVLARSSYSGSADLHATMEVIGAILGLIAGFALIVRFYVLGNRFLLFVGLAFFVNSAEDFVHGLLAFEKVYGFTGMPVSSVEQFIPGTYVTGRILMGVLLLAAPLAVRLFGASTNPKRETLWTSFTVIVITILITAVAFKIPLPKFINPEAFISRPVDFVSAIVLLVAFAFFLQKYYRERDMLTWWILLSIGVNTVGQIMMSFSKQLFDPFFDIAHAYKVLGYATPLLGFTLYQIAVITGRKRAEQEQERLLRDMGERVKELNCLYALSKIAEQHNASLEKILQQTVEQIPPSWRYPDVTCAKITFEGRQFNTSNFKETKWKLSAVVKIHDEIKGAVDIYYLQEKPESYEGPFLKEERNLINVIAERIGNIADHNLSEQKLIESENKARTLLESSPAGILAIDSQGNIVFVNSMLEKLFGYSKDEMLNQKIEMLLPERFAKVHPGYRAGFIKNPQARAMGHGRDLKGRRKDGSEFDVEIGLNYVETNKGPLSIAFITDIAERKRAEEEIRKLSRAVEQSPASIIITDTKGDMEYVNPKFTQISGYSFEEVVGKNPRILKSGETSLGEYKQLWKTITSGGEWRGEFHNKKKNGQLYWELASISSVTNAEGLITHFLAVKEDITERKQAEVLLQKAKKVAEAANEAKSEFLANMSHEIRTPLTAIIGYTDILARQVKDNPRIEENLSIIKKNGDYLLALINDILDLAKIESGKLQLDITECSIIQILHSCLSIFRAQADEKGIDLRIEWLSAMPETIKSDPVRLKQSLMNILSNAVKFTEEGSVVIAAKTIEQGTEAELEFTISDTGMGIKQEKLAEIFKPFGQADTSITRNFGGSGLGLTITRKIMEKFGGRITVESEFGKGAKFTLSFPIGPKDSLKMNEEPGKTLLQSERELKTDKSEEIKFQGKILLVDDTISNQLLFGEMLTMMGLGVDIAGNGKEAFESVKAGGEYDLVLMDLHMPLMSGYEALSKIREIKKEQIVIALTADAMTDTVKKCLEAGFDGFVSKPIVYKKLIDEISQFLVSDSKVLDTQNDNQKTSAGQNDRPICPEVALEQLNINIESYLSALEQAIVQINGIKKDISKAVENNDMNSIGEHAHAIKNTAGTLAMKNVYDDALHLEMIAKSKEQGDITEVYSKLKDDLDEAVNYAEKVLLKKNSDA